MFRILAALVGLTVIVSAPAASASSGSYVVLPRISSHNIAAPRVTIWLPPGYARSNQRFPVIYVNDSKNLLAARKSASGQKPGAEQAMQRAVSESNASPAIIVGIESPGADTGRTYTPNAIYAALPTRMQQSPAAFGRQPNQSDAYLRFVATELKPLIDRRYRTRADAANTGILGAGLGAALSLYALAEYPQVFGQAGCLSMDWTMGLDQDDIANSDARQDIFAEVWARYLVERLGNPNGRRLWFDHGDLPPDAGYGPLQSKLDIVLTATGWQVDRDVQSKVYAGTASTEQDWAARLHEVMGWLQGRHDVD